MKCMTGDRLSPYFNRFGLTSFQLKLMACAAMLLDHTALLIIKTLILSGLPLEQLYYVMRAVGRIAMPIFCFFVAQGVSKTGNGKLYAARMLCFAIVSEVPFDLMISRSLWDTGKQNVMFTLLLGMLSAMAIKYLAEHGKIWLGILTTALFAAAGYYCNVDYGMNGVLCVTLMYVALTVPSGEQKKAEIIRIVLLTASVFLLSIRPGMILKHDFAHCINLSQLPSLAAVPLLFLYNGKKGRLLDNVFVKYAFYAFYPLHMLMLVCIGMMI